MVKSLFPNFLLSSFQPLHPRGSALNRDYGPDARVWLEPPCTEPYAGWCGTREL